MMPGADPFGPRSRHHSGGNRLAGRYRRRPITVSTTSTKADGFRRIEVITGVGRRRRWTDEDKARIVAESLDPATTASAVARRYGLHVSQLFTWRQQLAASAARDAPAFVPVVVTEGAATPAGIAGRMEIALGPAVVRVGADVDTAALRRVLEAVRGLGLP
jgi:transposase